MPRPSKYSPELRERAVRMVFEHAHDYASQWAAVKSIAEVGLSGRIVATVGAGRRNAMPASAPA